VGLMGILADAVLEAGGEVHGVIPRALALREVMHEGVTRLEVVSGMHPRKARMSELADAFMALPGGYGTFEELFEMITWCQLGIHAKPIGVLNAAGYFDHLLAFLDEAVGRGFGQAPAASSASPRTSERRRRSAVLACWSVALARSAGTGRPDPAWAHVRTIPSRSS